MENLSGHKSSLIDKAVEVLNCGGVIVYPTDTLYGIGSDATNADAVKKVFEIKGRDFRKPLLVAVADVETAKKIVFWNKYADILAKKFLPGPLTLVLKKKIKLPEELTCGSERIGVRIPNNSVTLKILKKFGKPITTTSANISGEENITDLKKLSKEIKEKVDLIVPGRCKYKKPSTVIDLTERVKILRVGVISEIEIKRAISQAGVP